MKTWNNIWNNKKMIINNNLLESLLIASGYDTIWSQVNKHQFTEFITAIVKKLKIKSVHEVLEVGCGSGAFLYELNRISDCKIYGYDYSQPLIESANRYVVNGKFEVSEAILCPFNKKFDYVISHDVFKYFPNLQYAINTLKTMQFSLKDDGNLLILGLLDKSKEKEYYTNRKSYFKSDESYFHHYKNLEHLFFHKDDLCFLLKNMGFKQIEIINSDINPYENGKYMFNILASNHHG